MAWQKRKILLISVENITLEDGSQKKVYHRYVVNKSKGSAKSTVNKKLKLKKYNPKLRKHTVYNEAKYK